MPVNKILPGQGNTMGLLTPMIPFNFIVETDVGLLTLIYRDYMDEEVFYPEYFENKTVRQMVYDLYTRKSKNPLSLCIREEYEDMADTFYQQFMEREYDNILDLSVVTEFYRVIDSFEAEAEIRLTILCNSEAERDVLLGLRNTKECNIVLTDSPEFRNVLSCNQFYFKSIEDTVPFAKYLKRKSVYIANYAYNRNEEGHLREEDGIVPLLILQDNEVSLIDVFNMSKLEGDNNK